MQATGRRVLIGTRSVAASEHLASLLDRRGMRCRVLNAVRNDAEAAVIARAGEIEAITMATNMAGRGTDIRIDKRARERGGLHVILTEADESRRIDRQLRGRSGRQGDSGTTRLFCSAEDELLRRFLGPLSARLLNFWRQARFPGRQIMLRLAARRAQTRAERKARRRFLVMRQDAEMAKSTIGGEPLNR